MIAQVQFKSYNKVYGGQAYAYKILPNMKIKEGDEVIVDSPTQGYQVVKVSKILDDHAKASKFIIAKIDDSEYKEYLDKITKKFEIEKRLKKIEDEYNANNKYRHLAMISPEAARLVQELGEL